MMRDFKCVTMLQDNAKLTPNYPAYPGPPLAPKLPKMAPSCHQIESKNRPKIRYPIGLGGHKWDPPSTTSGGGVDRGVAEGWQGGGRGGWQRSKGCHPPATPLPPCVQDGGKISLKRQRNKNHQGLIRLAVFGAKMTSQRGSKLP